MRRIRVVLIIALFLLPAIAHASAEMSFTASRHDFGDVIAGEQLHYEFKFSSTGTEDLQIMGLSPG